MRFRTVIAVGVIVAVGAVTVPAGAAVATSRTTGDPATIAFYRTVAAATAAKSGLVEVSSGFSSVREASSLPFSWAQNEAPSASFTPVVDHITIAAKAGKIIWISDVMTPQHGCKPTAAHMCEPAHIELTPKGLFAEVGASGCATQGHGSLLLFSAVGGPIGYQAYGHFLPMVRKGANVVVTSTYPVGAQVATEVDTIPYATRLPIMTVVHVAKAKGRAAFTSTTSTNWLSQQPAFPAMRVCTGGTT
ncbi:MAG TPA: hypothetical protein VFN61_13425 [Acidimicrobiales bacterium]|nr:hypothetical protein [Acidimicrobiales bacterium]